VLRKGRGKGEGGDRRDRRRWGRRERRSEDEIRGGRKAPKRKD